MIRTFQFSIVKLCITLLHVLYVVIVYRYQLSEITMIQKVENCDYISSTMTNTLTVNDTYVFLLLNDTCSQSYIFKNSRLMFPVQNFKLSRFQMTENAYTAADTYHVNESSLTNENILNALNFTCACYDYYLRFLNMHENILTHHFILYILTDKLIVYSLKTSSL